MGWDGTAFVIVGVDKGAIVLQRVGTDGTLLGPVARSAGVPQITPVEWIDPSPSDGTIRIGLVTTVEVGPMSEEHVSFMKVRLDGSVVVPKVDLTPDANSAQIGGSGHLPTGGNVLLWFDLGTVDHHPYATYFDDSGAVTGSTDSGTGIVGVLTSVRVRSAPLALGFVQGARRHATTQIAPVCGEGGACDYRLAAGSSAFGVFWVGSWTPPVLNFTVRTP